MIKTVANKAKVVMIADIYDSDINFDGDTIIIHYPERGTGCAIIDYVARELDALKLGNSIKHIHTEQTIEVRIYD